MADIQLIIAADVTDVNRAIDSVNKLERQARQTGKAFASGKIDQDNYNQSLLEITRSYGKYSTSRQKASADVRRFAKEEVQLQQEIAKAAEQKDWFASQRRKIAMMEESNRIAKRQAQEEERNSNIAAKATQQHEAAVERLKLKYNETYAAATSFKRQLGDLNTLHKSGGISADQHRLKVEALKNEYRAYLNGSATQMNQFVQGQNLMTKGANRSGMAVQQMGYQVGDFLVQVQSGTNWMVAFGQQATQLVGVLPMVASSFGLTTAAAIGLSTVLGIGIPLVTAIGAAWMRTSSSQDKAAESTSRLDSQIKSLDETIRQFVLTKRAAEAGVTVNELLSVDSLDEAQKSLVKAREEYERLLDIATASTAGGGILFSWGSSSGVEEATQALAAAEERLANVRRMQSAERLESVAEERQALQDQLRISQLILKYGEDSIFVTMERVAQERRVFEESLRSKDIGEETVKSLLEQFDALKDSEIQIDRNNNALGGVNSQLETGVGLAIQLRNALAASAAASLSRMEQISELNSQINAAKGHVAGSIAQKAAMSSQAAQNEEARRLAGSGMSLDQIAARAVNAGQQATEIVNLQEELSNLTKPVSSKKSSGAGGSKRKSSGGKSKEDEDYLSGLLKEIEYKRKIVGLNDEQTRTQEIIFELTKRGQKVDNNRIKTILELEEATRKATEAEDKRKNRIETFKNNMEDVFKSIITGSGNVGDAISNTFQQILLDIYQEKVIKNLSSNLLSIFGFAKGGVFQGGNVKPFATGGVVNSPTFFPMAGGPTGLMGEAGPEAIMPLKRTASGKLGVVASGGSNSNQQVVINNNFSFAANGDESVKKIIAEAAPTIAQAGAQLAQKQMIDSRRRGGAMKAAFN